MTVDFFDVESIQQFVRDFADEIPNLLARHLVTVDLVPAVTGLADELDEPFTVAVVGQMKVGKSSLINALVGKELAVTGVTETTATINWIRHGENPDIVRVHWRDEPPETIARDQLAKWTGDSDHAARTKYLELYDDADFLTVASIVDTPGFRSTIGEHDDATNDFLGTRHEQETHRLGSGADAIVYVVMPVARGRDEEFLNTFKSQTRLPGSSSFNAVAVLHKWETLGTDDPVAESHRKAARLAETLSESVSAVLPVSAPMARSIDLLTESDWQTLLSVGRSDADTLSDLCEGEDFFADEECSVPESDREQLLRAGVPWPCLKQMVRLVAQPPKSDVAEFKRHVADLAAVDHLREQLDRRFFNRSRLLKILSIATRALLPCQTAEIKLRSQLSDIGRSLTQTQAMTAMLKERVEDGDAELRPVDAFVRTSAATLQDQHHTISRTLRRISELATTFRHMTDLIGGDVEALDAIEDTPADTLSAEEINQLRRLFGVRGIGADPAIG